MLVVTERALLALDELRAAERPSRGQALGLISAPNGRVGLVIDVPDPDDQVITRQGQPILFVERTLAGRFAHRVLDYVGAPGRERFVLGRSAS
jgi:hypothetical protein